MGTGFMGQSHGKRLGQIEGVTVAAICSRAIETGNALRDKIAATDAVVYTDFDRMLAEANLDMVYVCLPPNAHRGEVERAAERGIHLFLEKPIAYDVATAESMVRAIEKAGVVSQVGYHMRFRKGVERLKELMDSGEAGRPTLFQGRYWCNMLGKEWWRDQSQSHGQLFEQVIHIYDMALYFLGKPSGACGLVENLCHRDVPGYSIEDTSAGLVRFYNGAMASIVGSNCALPDHFIGDYRVVCERATLDFHSTGDWRVKDGSTVFRYGAGKIEKEEFVEDRDLYLAESLDFINAIRGGTPPRAPVRVGLETIRVVSAILDSSSQAGAAPVSKPLD